MDYLENPNLVPNLGSDWESSRLPALRALYPGHIYVHGGYAWDLDDFSAKSQDGHGFFKSLFIRNRR